jgi:hypothetical protein
LALAAQLNGHVLTGLRRTDAASGGGVHVNSGTFPARPPPPRHLGCTASTPQLQPRHLGCAASLALCGFASKQAAEPSKEHDRTIMHHCSRPSNGRAQTRHNTSLQPAARYHPFVRNRRGSPNITHAPPPHTKGPLSSKFLNEEGPGRRRAPHLQCTGLTPAR